MSVIELKSRIINKINSMEDEMILGEIYNLITRESEIETLYALTEIEKKAVEIGLKDIERGKVVSSARANELVKEWLKK